jgi:hypothetical protein
MNSATRRFRERSANRLHRVALLLEDWLDDWEGLEGETLSQPEYPFDQSLDEVISRLHHAVELLGREECDECGELTDDDAAGPSNQHAYSCSLYEPKHRANEPMVMIPQREHVDAMSARCNCAGNGHARLCPLHTQQDYEASQNAVGTSAVEIARTAFRRMVTAFEGGYHPDTTQYVRLPLWYTQERVDEVEDIARALGLDLYAEALAATQEALSP